MNITILFPHDPITFSNLFGNMFDVVRRHIVIHEDELKRIVQSFRPGPGSSTERIESILQTYSNIFVRNPQGFVQIDQTCASFLYGSGERGGVHVKSDADRCSK